MQRLCEQGLCEKRLNSIYKHSFKCNRLCSFQFLMLVVFQFSVFTSGLSAVCVNQAVGLGDLPQRLHAQFVVVRQFSH